MRLNCRRILELRSFGMRRDQRTRTPCGDGGQVGGAGRRYVTWVLSGQWSFKTMRLSAGTSTKVWRRFSTISPMEDSYPRTQVRDVQIKKPFGGPPLLQGRETNRIFALAPSTGVSPLLHPPRRSMGCWTAAPNQFTTPRTTTSGSGFTSGMSRGGVHGIHTPHSWTPRSRGP